MFAKTIIDSDAFLDMPMSARLLYYDLGMRGDDDGFVNNPRKIQRVIGCSEDDLKLLIAKRFIIPFESGVVVVKHWKINNLIRSDRYNETKYKEEKSMLEFDENGAYRLTSGIPDDNQRLPHNGDTQVRLGKVRLGKDNIYISEDKPSDNPSGPPVITLTLNTKDEYPIYRFQICTWNELYPAVDVIQELKKMKGWLDSNPTKRKTKRGILKFVNSWLTREQDKGQRPQQQYMNPITETKSVPSSIDESQIPEYFLSANGYERRSGSDGE